MYGNLIKHIFVFPITFPMNTNMFYDSKYIKIIKSYTKLKATKLYFKQNIFHIFSC